MFNVYTKLKRTRYKAGTDVLETVYKLIGNVKMGTSVWATVNINTLEIRPLESLLQCVR